jgi:hypothetical protein
MAAASLKKKMKKLKSSSSPENSQAVATVKKGGEKKGHAKAKRDNKESASDNASEGNASDSTLTSVAGISVPVDLENVVDLNGIQDDVDRLLGVKLLGMKLDYKMLDQAVKIHGEEREKYVSNSIV